MNELDERKLRISVVTPSHNRLEYLKLAIMSVQVSALAPLDIEFEHIIHDCGSTDGTQEYFLRNLPATNIFYIKDQGNNQESTKDRQWIQASDDLCSNTENRLANNIIYIRSEHKVPPSQARNICIQKSRGQFICVLVCQSLMLT
jgi:glycosyltransferase involved in cell wall biosynthesis